MWQFQWMFNLIPDSVLNILYWCIILAGITGVISGWLGRWIPFYGKYVQILKPLGVILLVLGVWLKGGYDTEMRWRNEVAKMQEKVNAAEAAASATTRAIEVQVVEKTKIIKEKGKTQIQYIDRVVTQDKEVIKYIEQCPVPKIIIDEHNKATVPPEAIRELNNSAEGKK